jgi:hypothetical protein
MDKLWNKVEELCTQETLIYITHDLDFAASRAGAKKIWVQSYAPNVWTWREIPSDEQLPEALVLEIIGNRKQLLFCEGERGGLDQTVYQLCFPQFHVIPRGGAEKVIESVKALRSNAELHAFAAQGIVDRDVRGNEEIAALASQGVYTLDFAEVENLLCTREVVKLVAARLSLNIEDTVEKVQTFVSNALADELEAQVVIRAERRIRYLLSKYTKASSDEAGLAEGVRDLVSGLDIPAIVAESRAIFAKAMASGQLDGVLRIFNRKTIADRVSTCFGLKAGEYPELVVRSLKMPDRKNLVEALLMGLPKLTGAHKAVEAVDPAAGALVQHRETG